MARACARTARWGTGSRTTSSAAWGAGASLLYLKLLGEYVDDLEAKELTDDAYTRNLVYEPATDVFGMLGARSGRWGRCTRRRCAVRLRAGALHRRRRRVQRRRLSLRRQLRPALLGFTPTKQPC